MAQDTCSAGQGGVVPGVGWSWGKVEEPAQHEVNSEK